jgi:uncharacterized Zn finger protein (UPF0148 family)
MDFFSEECPYCDFIIDDGSGWCPVCQTYISDEAEFEDYAREVMERDD